MIVSPLQPLNAELPILVMLSGIIMLASPLQPRNASSPIEVALPSEGIMLVLQPAINFFVSVSIIQLFAL